MRLLQKICAIALVICFAIPFCACGNSLPNKIAQEEWNSCRQYVKLSTGITMSYVEMGDPNGETIVLQHGMTDNSRSWSLSAPYFAEAGYHVYMPDLRGQGKSQEADGYYTTTTYATDLEAFFDAKGIDKAILVGHSLGSFTVQNFWLMFPERCSKIVLVSSIPLKGYQNKGLMDYYFDPIISQLKDDEHLDDDFMNNWYDCTYKEDDIDSETFETFIANMKKEAQSLSKKSWVNIFMGLLTSNMEDAYKYIDKTIPVLILHGGQDGMAKSQYQLELCKLLGIADENDNISADNYKEYSNIGHNIQFEIPKEFSNDVLYWLTNGTVQRQ